MGLKLLAATLLFVVLCSDVSSYRLEKRDAQEKQVLTQLQEAAKGYWDRVYSTAQNWLEQVNALEVKEKVSDMYEKSCSAVSTYLGIITDQAYHWWHSDQ